jgi:O-antigen/teichoic acid export membrane protein
MRKYLLKDAIRWISLCAGKSLPNTDAEKRYTRLFQSFTAQLLVKLAGILLNIVSVPLAISYLGKERYGIWITINTILIWASIADFGLNNGLTNGVSEAYAKNDHKLARSYISTTFYTLCLISLLLACILFAVFPFINWSFLFRIDSPELIQEVSLACAVVFGILLLGIPLSTASKILYAYQEGAAASYWLGAGNITAIIGLIIASKLHSDLYILVLSFSGLPTLVLFLSNIWLFYKHKPWLFPNISDINTSSLKKASSQGSMFFIVQISSLFIFQTDNFIVSFYCGSGEVATYNTTLRLFAYSTILQEMLYSSLWSAYAEAYIKDKIWIKKAFAKNLLFGLFSTATFSALLIVFGQYIIEKWAGKTVVPSESLLILMGIWTIIFSVMHSAACFLNGIGEIRVQVICSVLAAIANIIFSIVLTSRIGVNGVIIGTLLSYLLCIVLPVSIKTKSILSKF